MIGDEWCVGDRRNLFLFNTKEIIYNMYISQNFRVRVCEGLFVGGSSVE